MLNPIGVFDSGLGGKNILAAFKNALPRERFIYVSDDSFAPYGNRENEYILRRVKFITSYLLERHAKVIVAACNTATSVAIETMRISSPVPCLGVEPALKPSKRACGDGLIVVLGTEATLKQAKFNKLLDEMGRKNIILCPQSSLASMIEKNINNLSCLRKEVEKIFAPFSDIKGVVLGCTHYIYLKEMIQNILGEGVQIFDGVEGVTNRLKKVLEENNLLCPYEICPQTEFITF